MKRTISLAVVVALVAALLVWIFALRADVPATPTSAASDPTTVREQSTTDASLDAASSGASPREILEPETPSDAAREPQGFAFVLRERATGAPVAGADVFVLELSETGSGPWFGAVHDGLAETLARAVERGVRVKSDEHGRVLIEYGAPHVCVFARKESLAGFARVRVEFGPPTELWLDEDWVLDVRVVDESGAPRAGVPVALNVEGDSPFDGDVLTATTSDPHGEARLEHAGLAVALTPNAVHTVRIALPLDPPSSFDLDAQAGVRRVTLVMPPTGDVEVRIERRDGTPWLDPVRVWLQVDRLGVAAQSLGRPKIVEHETATGTALFRDVALHAWVRAEARLGRGATIVAEGYGPTFAGGRATLIVREEPRDELPGVRGRAIGEDGRPFADGSLQVNWSWGEPLQSQYTTSAKTDARGVFTVGVYRDPTGAAQIDFGALDADGRIDRTATADVVEPFGDAVIDIGDVVLRPLPILCAGRATREGGVAVANAAIRLQSTKAAPGFAPSWFRGSTADDGSFEVRGIVRCESFFAVASHTAYGSGFVECAPGATGLEIVLDTTARIEGSVLPSELLSAGGLHVADLEHEGTPGRYVQRSVDPDSKTGAFAFTGLAKGKHVVSLWGENWVGHAAILAELSLVAGETSRDARLQAIDAARLIRRFDVEVRTPDDKRARYFELTARVPGDTVSRQAAIESYTGRIALHSTLDEIDVELRAPEFRTVKRRCRPGTTEIVLAPGYDVRVKLLEPFSLPPPYGVLPVFYDRADEGKELNRNGLPFDASGECRVRLPDTGDYDVDFYLTRGESPLPSTIPCAQGRLIAVKDVAEPQVFELDLDRDCVQRTLAEARKDER